MRTVETEARHAMVGAVHVAILAAVVIFASLAGVVIPASANAGVCTPPDQLELVEVRNADGTISYEWQCRRVGTGGSNGGNGGQPTCDLSVITEYWQDNYQHCIGDNACISRVPSSISEEHWPDERPEPYAIYTYTHCWDENGLTVDFWWDWFIPDEPPIEDLAWAAYGALSTPTFTLAFNPPIRSYVRLDTWWWADGPGDGDITGTAAFGVVAIGEPDYIEVDPGDGSGSFQCPWTTTQSDACTYTYDRASVNGAATAADGSPAYPAEARLVYAVRFEQNGSALDLPALPDSLEGPWVSTPVPVAEIQATVID